jgi:hypothetical protein
MPYLEPVPIDPVTFGSQTSGPIPFSASQVSGPYEVGQNLYIGLIPDTGTGNVTVWKSIDGGASWIALDVINGPGNGGGLNLNSTAQFCFNAVRNVISVIAGVGPLGGFVLDYWEFDLNTESWVYLSQATYTPMGAPQCMVAKSNGDVVGVLEQFDGFQPRFVYFVIGAGGTWNVPVILDGDAVALYPGQQIGPNISECCIDDNDIVHVIFHESFNADAGHLFYIAISPALINFNAFTEDFSYGVFGMPCIVGNDAILFVGAFDITSQTPLLFIGSNVATPVWTYKQIDAGFTFESGSCRMPYVGFDGTTVVVTYKTDTPGVFQRVLTCTDFVNWNFTGISGFDFSVDPLPPGFAPFGFCPTFCSRGITFTNINLLNTTWQRWFMPFTPVIYRIANVFINSQSNTPSSLPNPASPNCS